MKDLFDIVKLFRFALVGGASTLIHLGASIAFVHFVFSYAILANLFGYIVAVPISFLGHSLITYKKDISFPLFFRFLFNNTSILLISLTVAALLDIAQVNRYLATSISVIVFPLISYVIHSLVTFKRE